MFTINLQSREPIYEQVYNNVVRLISLGVLQPKQQLPPVRQLATQLSVNPNTVSKAYKALEQDGIIYSVVGKGSFVAPQLNAVSGKKLEALDKIEQSVAEAKNLGIEKNEVLKIVDKIY
ncbi:MAG: GntR family transcriptional regulator [Ruminococcus sp.]|nr:GntR family transcriptional regulator [Ruminococcus sp.]MDD6447791.1 GntR family transcriptional regulator [Ruminococcus sp.]MDY2855556.1 GntR family transcriptional regulator [Oscillospiraceae bacterium]